MREASFDLLIQVRGFVTKSFWQNENWSHDARSVSLGAMDSRAGADGGAYGRSRCYPLKSDCGQPTKRNPSS